jgi:prephenate dehydratase
VNKLNTDIFYLGPAGTYTEIAADYVLKEEKSLQKSPKASILQVIESVDNSNGNIGIVPIENSIEGIVRETVDNLVKTTSRVMITSEILVPISHCLIAKTKDINKINKIISKPEAIAQCNYFIASNLSPSVEKIAASSTSEAVRQLTELPENYAAIGTFKAAEIYGMQIIARDINDEKDNLTRFVTLGSKVALQTGNDKTSIALTAHNQPGSLVDILSVFRDNGLNLSYIESRPAKKVFGDYTFFIDFDGHIEDESVQRTIGKIAPLVSFYRFLGSFPKGNIIKI